VRPEANWKIVALLISKRQIVVSNLVKVDCSVKSGGGFVHPWRLLGVESVPLSWAFKVPRVLRACRFASGGEGFKVKEHKMFYSTRIVGQ
jgi:hypothetical protein